MKGASIPIISPRKLKTAGLLSYASFTLELYLRRLLRPGFSLERFFQLQMQQQGVRQTVREYADGGVECLHRLVVSCTGHVNAVLRAFKLMLKVLKF